MELEAMIQPVVEGSGLELVDLSYHPGRPGVLQVTVDREGGVDLDTIAEVSERISRRLDLQGFEPGPYSLEVSSPGVERPLTRPEHFYRRVGEKVKVKTARAVDGTRTITGTLVEAGADDVRIATELGERTVPYGDIASARTVFEWGPVPTPGGPARRSRTKKSKGGKR